MVDIKLIAAFITKHEGRRRKPYKDSLGVQTIGVGWNMVSNPLPPATQAYLTEYGEITEEMIDDLLERSIRHTNADCHVIFPDFESFTDNRQLALLDFVFQLGFSRVKMFIHTLAAINTGRWEDAANEMRQSVWAKQVPTRAAEIIQMVKEG